MRFALVALGLSLAIAAPSFAGSTAGVRITLIADHHHDQACHDKYGRAADCHGHPADATAECRDHTYSYSGRHHRTCSRHGGVLRWFK